MAKNIRTVRVTSAQKTAAQALITRSAKTGRYLPASVSKIANAKATRSSARTGHNVADAVTEGASDTRSANRA